ncbi:MAG: helix-turn-helix domain-containing protein [bacterium]
MNRIKKRSDCPLSFSLDIFGDRWSLLIIRDIIIHGRFTFGEMSRSKENIASNILSDRLALLESESILTKRISPENKSKFIYGLTKKGIDLVPVIIEIMKWGAKYNPDTPPPPKKVIAKHEADKRFFVRKYKQRQRSITNV